MCLAKTSLAVTAKEAVDCEADTQVELAAAGPARTACWLGLQAEAFASGHEMGQVLVWMIPLDASGADLLHLNKQAAASKSASSILLHCSRALFLVNQIQRPSCITWKDL